MGLFDELLKKGKEAIEDVVNEVATDENKEKLNSFFQNLKQNAEEFRQELSQKEENQQEYYEEVTDGTTSRERILSVLATEFPQYTVEENVSPKSFGGTGRFMDYSMVVSLDGAPKLVIMLIGKTTTAHREYRWSRQLAEERGYTFLNFVEHYPNTIPYITDRLHKYL